MYFSVRGILLRIFLLSEVHNETDKRAFDFGNNFDIAFFIVFICFKMP